MTKPKYIYVLELQERGAIHVHMISNTSFTNHINEHGYRQITNWKHGFTNVNDIIGTDSNFKPYLYLLKYMNKAQRVGKSFIHTSRGLAKSTHVDYAKISKLIDKGELVYNEDFEFRINEQPHTISKKYYRLKEKKSKGEL